MSQRSVLVVGATGKQGGAVADHLLSGEYGEFDVYALTRRPESDRARALAEEGATVVSGDLRDKDSYRKAVDAVDAVYCMTHFAAGYDGEVEQGTNVAELAAAAGVDHLVFSSVGGAERNTGVPHFEAKWEVERHIRDLDLPATIVRPVFFMQNFETQREAIVNGTVDFPLGEGTSVQMVDVTDIGAFVATALANPDRYIGEAVELAGDEVTLERAAEILSTAIATDVEAEFVPIDVAHEQMGEDLGLMFEWITEYGYEAEIDDLERDHEIGFTDFEAYVSESNWTGTRGH